VQTHDDFGGARTRRIDLILSDFTLPAFDGCRVEHRAHRVADCRSSWCPDAGRERAVDSLRAATDYVLKERLTRPLGVRRAMLEVETRAGKQAARGQFIERKNEAIGQLASGVAHDFNNISGHHGLQRYDHVRLGPDGPLRKYTEEIRHASERAAD